MKKIIPSKRFLHGVLLTLALCLLPVLPSLAQGDIVDRLDKALGVTLPSEYKSKVKEFVKTNKVLKDEGTATFTQQFIEEEMKTDWGIDRQNQLLFIWHYIHSRITEKALYDEKDGNSKRLEDFNSKVINIRIRAGGQKYQNKVLAYMNQRSEEAKQRSAEAEKRSEEAKQRSAEAERRSAEAGRDKITKSLEDIYQSLEKLSSSIDKYEKIIDDYGLGQDAKSLLKKFQQEKEKVANKANEISTRLKNYEQLSESERDNIFDSVKKLQSDLYDQRSSVAERRSAEAERRSAEARQYIIMQDYSGLYEMMKFYPYRGSAYESEIKQAKEHGRFFIRGCEKFNIDYHSLLPLEVQKFYDIQPTKQNDLTCEQAKAQILTCALKELAKLYNLYQQAPQAERDINKKNVNSIIEHCKEYGIDYNAILTKELGDKKKVDDLLKFFEVE